jgi:hypothetical protein
MVPSGWLGEQVTTTAEAFGLLAAEIGMYSFLTYPLISMAYGGGHRGAGELLLTQRGAQVANELGLLMASATSAGPLYILAESDHELVVTTNNSFWPKKQYACLRSAWAKYAEALREDLIGFAQFRDLLLQLLQPRLLTGCGHLSRPVLENPGAQRLCRAPNLGCNRTDRRPLRSILTLVLQNHPYSAFTHFSLNIGLLFPLLHGSILLK